MIANAHALGMLLPHSPMPVETVYAISETKSSVSEPAIANASVHTRLPRARRRVNRSSWSAAALLTLPRQIRRARAGAEVTERVVAARIAALRDERAAVLEQAERDRAGRARLLARGLDLAGP